MTQLTARQAEYLLFIGDAIGKTGVPPTCREIGLALGGISGNAVFDGLAALQRKGFIVRPERGKSRGLRLTDKARSRLGLVCRLHTDGRIVALERVYAAAKTWEQTRCDLDLAQLVETLADAGEAIRFSEAPY